MADPSRSDSPSKADVEAQLRQTAETMSDRMDSIRAEVESTGTSVRNWVAENPLKSVGGMLAAGLAVGLLFGGRRSSRRRRRHEQLVDRYLDALRSEVDEAVAQGEEPGPALQKALRDRVPLVVYTGSEGGGRQSGESGMVRNLLGESFEILFRTGLSLLARDAIEALLANANIEDALDEELFE